MSSDRWQPAYDNTAVWYTARCARRYVDASSFQKCDDDGGEYARDPIGVVGAELQRRGFARHGQETMINGYTGEEMPCDIFIGLVYYQRLRHMVKDKFQVRCGAGSAACEELVL